MDTFSLLVIAVGLAMDAFAVSITSGCLTKRLRVRRALRTALFFGGFQALMPIIGYVAGSLFAGYISHIDHWIAFILLSFIGIKMIGESTFLKKENEEPEENTESLMVLLTLAVATSIDALAVGITFSLLDVQIIFCAAMIGIVTFVLSLLGVFAGYRFGSLFSDKIEIFGGAVLIGIGLKILAEHLFWA